MEIEKIEHNGREAFRLTHDKMEMIVVTGVGPRVMSFKWEGGPNLMFDDKKGLAYKNWLIYGGARFWVGPETEASYETDNARCETIVEDDRLIVFGAIEPGGLQKSMEFSENLEGPGFRVDYVLRNTGAMLASGHIWALTCVEPTGRILTPWGEGSEAWATQMVRFWRAWGGNHTSKVDSTQWKLGQETFGVEPTGEEGKAAVYTESGFMAQLRKDGTFIKTFEPIPEATYPDGCNVAFYTCEHFCEMETLSPLYTFVPGGEYVHSETWIATPEVFEADEWERIMDWMDV